MDNFYLWIKTGKKRQEKVRKQQVLSTNVCFVSKNGKVIHRFYCGYICIKFGLGNRFVLAYASETYGYADERILQDGVG